MKKNEIDKITIFLHFYVYLVVTIFGDGFLQKAYETVNPQAIQNCTSYSTSKPGTYYKKTKLLTKWPLVVTTVPLARTPSLGHWYTRIHLQICNPGPNNPTTFLGALLPG